MISSPQANHTRAVFSPDSMRIPAWKRTLDIVLILLALPVLIPLMSIIAITIRVVSRGPILFRQERVGFLGRPFMCLKFRTMHVGADTSVHEGHLQHLLQSDVPMEKMDAKGDPRIIPFGAILRSSGLDDLPQLINIFLGEMSLVGPRPCLPYEYAQYLPWQKERFNAVPGLTGLWQVNGKNRTTFVEMIQLDIKYARTQSPWLDLKIIFKTIPALIVQMRENQAAKDASNVVTPPPASVRVRPAGHYSLRETAGVASGHSFQQTYLTRKGT